MVELYKESPKEAVSQVLEWMTGLLKGVTVNCDTWESLQVVQAARRLYEPEGTSVIDRLRLSRRFARVS